MEEFKPGQVISPQGPATGVDSPQPTSQLPPTPTQPEQPLVQVSQAVPAPSSEPIQTVAAPAEESWQYRQEAPVAAASPTQSIDRTQGIAWTAAEFVAHDKTPTWYLALATAGVVASGLIYLITKDKITTAIIALALFAFGLFAARKPKTQSYGLDVRGLRIGQRLYMFTSFKSFAISEEGHAASVTLMPLKRFMPPLTIHLTPEIEDQAVDFLAQVLPFDQNHRDAVDTLMKRIRF